MRVQRAFSQLLVCVSLLITVLSTAEAGTFKVIPIKVYLEDNQKTQTLTLRNESEDPVTLQLEAMEWSQDQTGQDLYVPTKALVMFPKIVTIKAGAEQLIRLGYQGPPATNQERTYRVYMTELPISKPGESTLKMVMRLGVPVFITPAKGKPALEIVQTSLERYIAHLQVKNPSSRHGYVKTMHVTGRDASGAEVFSVDATGWYVLPGMQRTFPVKLPEHACARLSTISVSMIFSSKDLDQPPVTSTVDVASSHCSSSSP